MKQKTEAILCEAFIELLRKHPFPKITIQMISTSSGVNRQTFYYHFDNIYDLMERAFEYEFKRESHFEEEISWNQAMEKFLIWMKGNRPVMRNLLNNVDANYLRKAIYPIIRKCMTNGYQPNLIIRDIGDRYEEEFVQRFLTIGITQYILEWVMDDFKIPEEDVIDNIFLILKRMYQK